MLPFLFCVKVYSTISLHSLKLVFVPDNEIDELSMPLKNLIKLKSKNLALRIDKKSNEEAVIVTDLTSLVQVLLSLFLF
jgi:hypothetical protein